MFQRTTVAVLLASVCLCSCATVRQTVHTKAKYYTENTPDFDRADYLDFVAKDHDLVTALEAGAGVPQLRDGDDWNPVVMEGIRYVNLRCNRFMDALFWLNRVRETSSNEIKYAGAAASAVLALVNATKELLGIAPLAFGFADQTLNNVGQGLLYNLDPGTVRDLVTKEQTEYRKAIDTTKYTKRQAALDAVEQYAALCLPVNIEGQVNQAIASSQFQAVNYRLPVPGAAPAPPPAKGKAPEPPAPQPSENKVPIVQQKPPS